MMNAKQKLEAVDDIQDRIDLVAKDLESGKDRFKGKAEIGDGGDCFGCYGPYQIRDGKGASTKGLHEGESW